MSEETNAEDLDDVLFFSVFLYDPDDPVPLPLAAPDLPL